MFRFTMPSSKEYTKHQRIRFLNEEFNDFIDLPSISKLIELLGGDPYTSRQERRDFIRSYGNRSGVERQGIKAGNELNEILENNRSLLYDIYTDLGMLKISKPLDSEYEHILILGASYSASYNRTARAAEMISKKTIKKDAIVDVSALGAYRIVAPIERNAVIPGFESSKETEFGILCDSMEHEFGVREYTDEFKGNINTNKISCIRSYKNDVDKIAYKTYAAPGDTQRADSYKTYQFYLKNNEIKEHEKCLLFTNNVYVNYQFIPFCVAALQNDIQIDFDIIGISEGDKVTPMETYNPYRYLLDLASVVDWIYKFKCAF